MPARIRLGIRSFHLAHELERDQEIARFLHAEQDDRALGAREVFAFRERLDLLHEMEFVIGILMQDRGDLLGLDVGVPNAYSTDRTVGGAECLRREPRVEILEQRRHAGERRDPGKRKDALLDP